MKKFKHISNDELSTIIGGKGPTIGINIDIDDVFGFICGFLDGWNKQSKKGGC